MLASKVSSLEVRLASAPSQKLVDSMRHELRILKRLEYNADDIDADRDPEMTGVHEDEMKDLESVLVAKLRRVESELVRERNQKMDLTTACDQLKRDLAECEAVKEEAEKLVASLEADLEMAISSPATPKVTRRTSSAPSRNRWGESLYTGADFGPRCTTTTSRIRAFCSTIEDRRRCF